MICGLRGGAANTHVLTVLTQEQLKKLDSIDQAFISRECGKNCSQGNPNRAKECYGVEALPLLHFQDPTLSFSIASVHAQLGLREKLIDRLVSKEDFGPSAFQKPTT